MPVVSGGIILIAIGGASAWHGRNKEGGNGFTELGLLVLGIGVFALGYSALVPFLD
jgi:hypothetical protein